MLFNDRKAPRFNSRKYRTQIVSEDLYKRWKEESKSEISFKEFKNVWNIIAEGIISNVLEERDGVKLGASLGEIYRICSWCK